MSYIDRHRPAPLAAETIQNAAYRAVSAIGDLAARLRPAPRGTMVTALTPSELEDIGLSVADLPASRPGLLAQFVAEVRDWNARRRTVAELERLSDAQLADIGLMRAHVEDLRRGRFI